MSNPASMFEGGKGESRAAGDILVTELGRAKEGGLQPCGPFHSSAAAKKTIDHCYPSFVRDVSLSY
jgi:hypothetical protein